MRSRQIRVIIFALIVFVSVTLASALISKMLLPKVLPEMSSSLQASCGAIGIGCGYTNWKQPYTVFAGGFPFVFIEYQERVGVPSGFSEKGGSNIEVDLPMGFANILLSYLLALVTVPAYSRIRRRKTT